MSKRRQVYAGKITGNSRRTTCRFHLFTPDAEGVMEQIFWYCLAVSANEHDIAVYAATLLSTHPHYSTGDRSGRLPKFKQMFHRILAMCTKRFRNWDESVFNRSAPGEHELLTPQAMVNDLAYTIANGATSGAVRRSADWPGAKTLATDIGTLVVRVERPPYWFNPRNPKWPKVAELKLEVPELLLEHYGSLEAVHVAVAERVAELEEEAARELASEGRSFQGVRRVLRGKPTDRSRTPIVSGQRNPEFAAGGDKVALRAAIALRRAFDAAYDDALAKWRDGDRDVVFPFGTWWMRVHHRARCATTR